MKQSLSFEEALTALKDGYTVSREGWNGKGMFLYLVQGSEFQVNRPPLLGIYPEGTNVRYGPHIDIRAADGTCYPWLASQADLLANDWQKDSPVENPLDKLIEQVRLIATSPHDPACPHMRTGCKCHVSLALSFLRNR